MFKYYKIAKLSVAVENPGETTTARGKQYEISPVAKPDIIITADEVNKRIEKSSMNADIATKRYMYEGALFYNKLIDFGGIKVHASTVVYKEYAYLFSATSGTGKSTHTSSWLKLFPNDAYILNDDKPAVRIINGEIFAYGTPWSGKYDISVNKGVKIKGICFITRDDKNWIRQLDAFSALGKLYHSTIKRIDKEKTASMLKIIDYIIKTVKIWEMGCLPDLDAAKLSFENMSGEKL